MTAGPVDLRYKFDIDIILYNIWMLPGIVWNCPWFNVRPIFQARNNIIFESVYSVYGSLIQKFLI